MKPRIQYLDSLPAELLKEEHRVEFSRLEETASDELPDAVVIDLDIVKKLSLPRQIAQSDIPLLLFFGASSRVRLVDMEALQTPLELFDRSAPASFQVHWEHALKRIKQEETIHGLRNDFILASAETRSLLKSIDEVIFTLSPAGIVQWCHRPSSTRPIFDPGVDPAGKDLHASGWPAATVQVLEKALTEISQTKVGQSFKATFDSNGKSRTFEFHASYRENGSGEYAGITVAGRDITELLETRSSLDRITEELENSFMRAFELAFTDRLTGLPNKEALMQTLEMSLEQRSTEPTSLMLLHIRNLSNIRNSTRFETGNQILKILVERLKTETDRETFLARYGEDEFALFMSAKANPDITNSLIHAMEAPVKTDSMEFTLSCSAGIAMYPDDAQEMESLVQSAEIALREARETGVEKVRLFSPEDRQRLNYRIQVETELLKPHITDEMSLVYQPIVDATTRKIRYLEVLLRWKSPALGDVPPDLFIPLAEKNGVIISLTNWMINESTRVLQHLPADVRFSINLSPVHLLVPTLVEDITGLITAGHAEPDRYKIEITEGVFIRDPMEATQRIHSLKGQGFSIALDDFGVGFSSLSYMGLLPVDSIKIDRSFLQGYPDDRRSSALIESILTLTRSFAIDSIAEGVEKEEQLEPLSRLGCDMFQGYLLYRPLREKPMLALFS